MFSDDDASDLQSMWEPQPVMRSMGGGIEAPPPQFHSLDAPLTRGSYGVDTLSPFGGDSFWGSADMPSELSFSSHSNLKNTINHKLLETELSIPTFEATSTKNLSPRLPHSTFALSESLVEEVVKAPALESIPFYLEKYTSYRSESTVTKVLDALVTSFAACGDVDIELRVPRNQIKGVASDDAVQCHFRVQLYKDQGNGLVVEFQRRSGCSVSFSRFVDRTVASLPRGIVTVPFAENTELTMGLQSLDLSEDTFSWPEEQLQHSSPPAPVLDEVALDESTLDILLAMASSAHVDVQREALQALVSSSQSEENVETIVKVATKQGGMLETLQKNLTCADAVVRHCAACLVRNLCCSQRPDIRTAMIDVLGAAICSVLELDTCLDNKDTKRSLADACTTLANTHATELANSCLATTLRDSSLINSQDLHLRQSVQITLDLVAAC